ncbi:hypothetical protein U9M48_008990 [Paspalum notatum var. saurae]|uniref:DDE Tnp4 domain-containing protein n=1 Tax=Paspalum notatum var. saurae TaxID=547442 RepID=A0AAQ3SQ47_PASNO
MYTFSHTVLVPKDPTYSLVHRRLAKYAPYFDGCIGALDGTHIRAQVKKEACRDFTNRKGETSFNVLAIVDMDMRFTYVGVGMAGACHEMEVMRECMRTPNFPRPPPGKYYLVDAGYAVRNGYLGPYRYIDEDTMEAHFNSKHASLRSVVERAFGVLKSRWHILREIPCNGPETQSKYIIACFALHNFLLDRIRAKRVRTNIARDADYVASDCVDALASKDTDTVRAWIAHGLYGG